MEQIPLRDYLDQRFRDHQKHVDERFDDVKSEIKSLRDHSHPGYVLWAALVPLLVSMVGLLVLWLG